MSRRNGPNGRILLGYDGRDSSRDALALAVLLAEAVGAELIIGVVNPAMRPSGRFHRREEALSAWSDPLFAQATAALDTLGYDGHPQHRAIGGLAPADGLRALAASEGAALVVIGSTHRSPPGTVMPGTTADALIAGSDQAFAVAPRDYAVGSHGLRLIGIAYDGSADAKRAAAVAQALATIVVAPLRAFGVRRSLTEGISPGAPVPLSELEQPVEEELDRLLAELPPGFAGQKVVLSGHPADALLEQGPMAAELMVFGSHGFGRFMRLLAGSVSSQVVRSAPWPVLVVPPHAALPFGANDPLAAGGAARR